MKNRVITIVLSFILCFSAAFAFSGCDLFQNEFTVTFVAGEGKESAEIQGNAVQSVKSAKELVPPVFIFEGFWHDGWDKVIKNINSDTTVTALWVEKKFEVIFEPGAPDAHLKDLSPADNNQVILSVASGVELEQKAPQYIREGYTVSWDKIDFGLITDKTVLTPEWIANEYTLSFYNSDDTKTGLADKTVTFMQPVGDLPSLNGEDGKIFAGWQLSTQGNQLISNESVWIYPENGKLTPLWRTPGEYTITYVNAYNHDNFTSYKTEDGYTLLEPKRKGYTFIGWSGTGIDGTQLTVTINPGEQEDKTYTAHWKPSTYNLMFNADGGSVDKSSMQVEFMKTLGELPVAEKEGYEFVYWTTKNGTIVTENTIWTQTESTTVYAQYKRIYTIKFVLDCTTSRGAEVSCIMPSAYINQYSLTKVDGENAYIMTGYKEGDSLPDLPRPTTHDEDEYAFSSWKYNSLKKTPGMVLNEDNFPGSTASGVITLVVACYALWTPFY